MIDFGLLVVPRWAVIGGIVTVVFYKYYTWFFNTFSKRNIRGPWPVPILGNLGGMMKQGIHQWDIEQINEFGRTFGYFEGRMPILLIADKDLLREVLLKNSLTHFTNRRDDMVGEFINDELLDALIFLKGEKWKKLRSVWSPTFSAGKLKKMMPLINSASDTLVNNLQRLADENTEFEAKEVFGSFAMDVIASTMFGIEIDSQTNPDSLFVKHAKQAFGGTLVSPIFILFFFFPFLVPVIKMFTDNIHFLPNVSCQFFKEVIETTLDQRRRGQLDRPDMIHLMLAAHMDDGEEEKPDDPSTSQRRKMTNKEILSNAMVFFLAGYETTATALAFMGHVLARYPDIQTRLKEEVDSVAGNNEVITYEMIGEMTYLDEVWCETLRMWPPAARSDRTCTKDMELDNGVLVERGDQIAVPIYAIHHTEDYWPNHLQFDPKRFSKTRSEEDQAQHDPHSLHTYLPFGCGPRACVGQRLAALEAKLAVVKLLQRFRVCQGQNFQSDEDINTFRNNAFTYPAKGIHLEVQETNVASRTQSTF